MHHLLFILMFLDKLRQMCLDYFQINNTVASVAVVIISGNV